MATTTTTNYDIPIPPLGTTGTTDGYGTLMEAADGAIKSAIDLKISTSVISTDGTMASNSDALIPSQKAVKTYADNLTGAVAGMTFKGLIDCAANPNYPAGVTGDTYRVSVAGKIGGASGLDVEIGDLVLCITDNAGGTQAAVGSSWTIAQQNIEGAVTGPVSAVDGDFAVFNGTTGVIVKDGGTLGSMINAASAKTSAVDADMLPLMDSQAANVVKKLSWAYVKSILKTYFDGLYEPVSANIQTTVADVVDLVTLSGVAANAQNMGVFTGTTLSDTETIKTAFQALETAVEGVAGGHDAVTVNVAADTVLSITGQQIGLDTQIANRVFSGPTSGAAAVPAFRSLVAADIPDISASYLTKSTLAALATGILKNTTTTGALSIATAADLPDHSVVALPDNTATTLSLSGGTVFTLTSTIARTITNFTDGVSGKTYTIFFADGNTTLDFTTSNLYRSDGIAEDIVMGINYIATLIIHPDTTITVGYAVR